MSGVEDAGRKTVGYEVYKVGAGRWGRRSSQQVLRWPVEALQTMGAVASRLSGGRGRSAVS